MASGRPTFSVVAWPKRCAPRMLKRKLTIGSLRAAVEGRLRVGQIAAFDDDAALDGHALAAPSFEGNRSTSAAPCWASMRNSSFAVLPEDILQTLRVLETRHLDEDPVGALALDVRLGRAQRVDAAAKTSIAWSTARRTFSLMPASVIGELDQAVRA